MRKSFIITPLLLMAFCTSALAQSHEASPEEIFEKVWRTFDQGYALFETKSVDWHKLHDVYRPRIVSGMTEEELFAVLTGMLSHLNDNHVILMAPSIGRDFSAGYIGPYIEEMGFEGALQFLQQHPLPEIYFKNAPDTLGGGVFQYGWVGRNVGYIHFYGFQPEAGNAVVIDSILNDFSSARALIVDIRYNSGGHDGVGKIIAKRFADKRRLYMVTRDRNGPEYDDFREPIY
ncbi:MAG TPA: S41 family peptidase, partial [Candidatus Krumholzibacteriaceae bacterium]|nr:S41 family peptidase [Candidatus Krumholzibacteriaceae bacterium]